RRGEILGALAGATAVGALVGPLLGGIAVAVGAAAAFGVTALVVAAVAMLGAFLPGPGLDLPRRAAAGRRHLARPALVALWVVAMPGFLIGVTSVLGPLKLSRLGAEPGVIVAVYLAAACAGIALRRRVGRESDRRGRMRVLRPLFAASAILVALLAA